MVVLAKRKRNFFLFFKQFEDNLLQDMDKIDQKYAKNGSVLR